MLRFFVNTYLQNMFKNGLRLLLARAQAHLQSRIPSGKVTLAVATRVSVVTIVAMTMAPQTNVTSVPIQKRSLHKSRRRPPSRSCSKHTMDTRATICCPTVHTVAAQSLRKHHGSSRPHGIPKTTWGAGCASFPRCSKAYLKRIERGSKAYLRLI